MRTVYIAVGTNLGDRRANVAFAREAIGALAGVNVMRVSRFYETEPLKGEGVPTDQGMFLNGVLEVVTDWPLRNLLEALKEIELAAGREAKEDRVRWGARVLDLDIVLSGNEVLREDDAAGGLIVPHERMYERWFVLQPLSELAGELVHPTLGLSINELLDILPAEDISFATVAMGEGY
ncbi:2-amino-4-hydroxy-6-hydroxymethyldihydropteridine diphosphokinase [Poriferisphaera sp. WC338]|uniref:2-amino-4-hydroxy-6- hydroxymethyldihydropteridine diphosphokinase n=1 Tax=Poriferisphaera sp. WC338 TaxID=3425129 RepID=UPI003D817765